MNKDIEPVLTKILMWMLPIGFFAMIGYGFWYYSDPYKFPIAPTPKCEMGWNVDRRFGGDEFLGDIPEQEARNLAGSDRIYYDKNPDVYPCD